MDRPSDGRTHPLIEMREVLRDVEAADFFTASASFWPFYDVLLPLSLPLPLPQILDSGAFTSASASTNFSQGASALI